MCGLQPGQAQGSAGNWHQKPNINALASNGVQDDRCLLGGFGGWVLVCGVGVSCQMLPRQQWIVQPGKEYHMCVSSCFKLQPIAPHLQSRAGTGQDIRSVSWLLTCFSSPMRSDSASIDRSLFRSKDSMSMASCTHACSLVVQHCCAYCQSGL